MLPAVPSAAAAVTLSPAFTAGAATPQYRHVTPFASSTSTTPPHSASSLTETTLPALAAVTLSSAGAA